MDPTSWLTCYYVHSKLKLSTLSKNARPSEFGVVGDAILMIDRTDNLKELSYNPYHWRNV